MEHQDRCITYPIEDFFEAFEWKRMSDYEKWRFPNRKENYEFLNKLGFDPSKPEFMTKVKSSLYSSIVEGIHAKEKELEFISYKSNCDEVVDNFEDMGLNEDLLRGIYAYGFEKPSAIQQRAIIPCVKGQDVIAQAQSGTGKTVTFSIAILQQINTALRETQALILAPTRELAQQIQRVVIALGDYMGAQCHACIGGTNVREDIRKLETGVHVVVGTPGRVFDMINRKALRTEHIRIFVLDEADQMLSRRFKDQIYDVFRTLNSTIQVILLSATMPADVLDVTKQFMRDPIRILVKKEELTLEGIKQFYIAVDREDLNGVNDQSPLFTGNESTTSTHRKDYDCDSSGKLVLQTLMSRTEEHLKNIEDLKILLRSRVPRLDDPI
ncbi:hypothetical protein JTE90_019504 [Oedothorax gibbosus]|uniref:RNA helicase n=1 Tax=Oedothorax gibbosus TaxID=931172 RepID=A0AAV6VHN3_9ARAC|nr:hypothetical protein JTE90_019504 [Oedothorax gibbosus]